MRRGRVAGCARAVKRYVRAAPGTHVYLLVLLVTTTAVQSLHPVVANELLRQLSTNLTQMGRSAGRVLFLSAFLLDRRHWLLEVVLFTVVYVPLERWVGTWRWLAVVVLGHVGATLVTTIGIWADVRSHRGGLALTGTIDVGVSYGCYAAAGLLVFRFSSVWWRVGLAVVVGGPLVDALVRRHGFTEVGHAAAAVLGAACYLVLARTTGVSPLRPPVRPWARPGTGRSP